MNWLSSIIGIALVLTSLLSGLFLLKWWQRRHSSHPEIVRKLLHVFMGCVAMTFPLLFKEDWPVWILALSSSLVLTYLKARSRDKAGLGSVLCAVERPTHGELCFALGVATLFSLSHGHPALYFIPLFILTMSDTLAALGGIYLGHLAYRTVDGKKTAEGSLCFFLSACCGTAVLLGFLSNVSLCHALLIGVLLGCLATLFEAIAWDGLDNLFIPLSSFIMLKIYLYTDTSTLLQKIAVSLVLLVATITFRKWTKLNDSAVLGSCLFSYISWAVGGPAWLLAPLTVFLAHKRLLPSAYQRRARKHNIYGVLSVAGLGFVWLFLSKVLAEPHLFFFYTLSYCAHLAVISMAHLRRAPFCRSDIIELAKAALLSWVLIFVPFILLEGLSRGSLLSAFAGLLATSFAVTVFRIMPAEGQEEFQGGRRWARQLAVVTAANIATILVLAVIGSKFV